MQISELYGSLKEKPSGHAFTVMILPGREGIYLGVDKIGRPCLFAPTSNLAIEPSLHTAHVSLRVGQMYTVAPVGEQSRSERFDALFCETKQESEIATFLVLIDAFLAQSSNQRLSRPTLVSFFRSLTRLFSEGPARDLQGERQGLWGELFVMSRVRGFMFWAPFWHKETTRKFDFSTGSRHVEVKTAQGDERVHHFAHRQVYELQGEETMIASVLLRKEDGGLSLRELIIQARQAFRESENYLQLEQAIRQAGMESDQESGPSYDSKEAEQYLAWYRAADAPHFRMPEPPGVSQTHYRIDLSLAPQVRKEELEAWLRTWEVPVIETRMRSAAALVPGTETSWRET